MNENSLASLFTWRSAIASEGGPDSPTTRHVLLTLSLHMNERGESAFPSTARLATETGLSERSVCTHLKTATEQGWVTIHKRKRTGSRWMSNLYYPQIPRSAVNAEEKARTETGSVPFTEEEKNTLESLDYRDELDDTERGSVTGDKPVDKSKNECGVTEPDADGTESDDNMLLKEVQSSTSVNSSLLNYQEPVDKSKEKPPQKLPTLKTAEQWLDWFIQEKGYPEKQANGMKAMEMYRDLEKAKVPLEAVKKAIKTANAKLGKKPDTPMYYRNFITVAFNEWRATYRAPKPAQWYDDETELFRVGAELGIEYVAGTEIHEYRKLVLEAIDNDKKVAEGSLNVNQLI